MDVFGAGGVLDEEQFILFAHDLVKSGPGVRQKLSHKIPLIFSFLKSPLKWI